MSTIKSSAENLTLNADGANNDIKFQSNGSEVASIDQAGNIALSGTVDGVDVAAAGTLASAALPKAGGTMTGALDLNHSINVSHNSGVAAIIANSAASQLALRLDQTNASEPYGMVIDFSAVAKNNTTNYFILCEDSSAAKFKVFSSGQVQTPSVLFGTDTAAANALNDYEEGTWTPNVGGTATYNTQVGKYTKIGNMVTLVCEMNINALNNGSAQTMYGAPFTPIAGAHTASGAIGYASGLAVNIISLTFRMDGGSTNISNAILTSATDTTASGGAIFGNGARVLFSITYIAA